MVCTSGCSNRNTEDIQAVKEVLTGSYTAMEHFVSALDKASDNDAIASAIRRYEQDLDQLLPKARQAGEAMKKIHGAQPPDELKEILEKTKDLTGPFMASYNKVVTHAQDPAVRQALLSMMKKNNEMPALTVW